MKRVLSFIKKLLVQVALIPIYLYRLVLSPLSTHSCRFEPTCSKFALISIKRHGVFKGYYLGGLRVLRCQPLNKKSGGYDPVPFGYAGGAKWVI